MTTVTLLIAAVMSGLACFLSQPYALAVMIASMVCYPSYLVVRLGVFDISVGRFVVFFFFLRCLLFSRRGFRFQWNALDTLMCVNMGLWVVIPILVYGWPTGKILENRSGMMMDTFLIYWVYRLSLRDLASLSRFLKVLPLILIPLAVMGLMESITGYLPYTELMKYCPWERPGLGVWTPRMGLMRAVGFAGHPIMFGILFVMFIPLFYSMKHLYLRKEWCYFCLLMLMVGCFSSMSSGPWMMGLVLLFFLYLEKKKGWIKPLIGMFILLVLLVAILSNRPFYHVFFSYLNPIGGTSWHRAKLIELAIQHFSEWCLYGYGGVDPGWGPALGARWTDITNHFILIAVDYGLVGFVFFLTLFVYSIYSLRAVYRSAGPGFLKTLCWAYGSMMAMFLITLNSCTLFDQTRSLLFFQFGVIGSILNLRLLRPADNRNPILNERK
jgi:hypothetical protein